MNKLILISGPCVIENRNLVFETANFIKEITDQLGIRFIFKASFDKANRSSSSSFRGLGIDKGLEILGDLKTKYGVDIITDIHESSQAKKIASVADIIQIPAFLCRQTDLLEAVTNEIIHTNKIINIKKGQFLAPWDMAQVVKKINNFGLPSESQRIWVTERGSCFGYNTLVVDYRSFSQMKTLGCPVIFDATHSVQQPGGMGERSGGQREFVAPLARAAAAVGVDGFFMEVHPEPEKALSDGPNMVPLYRLEAMLRDLLAIRKVIGDSPSISTI
jgi:2-dehydro-3-deoxyphosphooctonate aldolase (KDO 8-P synthase)